MIVNSGRDKTPELRTASGNTEAPGPVNADTSGHIEAIGSGHGGPYPRAHRRRSCSNTDPIYLTAVWYETALAPIPLYAGRTRNIVAIVADV